MMPQDKKALRILLVEDSEADIKLTVSVLKNASDKYDVIVAKNGQEAIKMIGREDVQNPDVILMDIFMPSESGLDVLRKLKDSPESRHIPVVMLTGSGKEEDVIQSYRYGASSYITKPMNPEEFSKIVQALALYWNINAFARGGEGAA